LEKDRQMLAKDIMTANVVKVKPDDEVGYVAQVLLDHRISAAPVVDQAGHLRGIVSEGDLMRRAEGSAGRSWWLDLLTDKTRDFTRMSGTRVRDVMTREVISVDEETSISEIAHILEANGIKRVPVLLDGRLVGVASRADVLRGLAAVGSRSMPLPSVDDRQVRADIVTLIGRQTSASLQAISVIVVNGVVYLWGTAESETDKDAIRVAAETIAGTTKVHDFVNTLPSVLSQV